VAAADDSVSATLSAGLHGGWWQLGSDGARRDAIVVAALALRADTRCSCTFSRFFAPTASSVRARGTATEASGHLLRQIDGRLAGEVLDEWAGGAMQAARARQPAGAAEKGAPLNVIREFALLPLALLPPGDNEAGNGEAGEQSGGALEPSRRGSEDGSPPCRLVHARAVHADGSVECFGAVCCGEVQMLATRRADLHAALAAAAADACARATHVVDAALVSVCAGVAGSNADRRLIYEVLQRCFPHFALVFVFGEVGMQAGRAVRGGGMIHIALFGRLLSVEGRDQHRLQTKAVSLE